MSTATDISKIEQQVWDALQEVKDPEIPVVSLVELGMITKVEVRHDNNVLVVMTPTFVGCPAIVFMQNDVRKKVKELGFENVEVKVNYDTPWNSNRVTDEGKRKLKEFGLSPPKKHKGEVEIEDLEKAECPHCSSTNTTLNSPFGPTLCRALHFCYDCGQGFEQFKPV